MAKILLTLPDNLLKQLDNRCQERSFTRSELVRDLIRREVWVVEIAEGNRTGGNKKYGKPQRN